MSGHDPAQLTQAELGRLLTRLERDPVLAQRVMAGLPVPARAAQRIGITGSPGVGKSTLLGRLLKSLGRDDNRIGVIAIDPSSPLTHGALLGDRLRLAPAADEGELFVRSMASRGSQGGLAPAASVVGAVLEAAGYSQLLIETVGTGQTGYDILSLADTVVALFSPEGGDALQLMKAGPIEFGDILVVNKADRPGAETLRQEIQSALQDAARSASAAESPWSPPVLSVVASTGEGIIELAASLAAHRSWLAALPLAHPRRLRRLRGELGLQLRGVIEPLLVEALSEQADRLAQRVQLGQLAMGAAGTALFATFLDAVVNLAPTVEEKHLPGDS